MVYEMNYYKWLDVPSKGPEQTIRNTKVDAESGTRVQQLSARLCFMSQAARHRLDRCTALSAPLTDVIQVVLERQSAI